MQQFEFCEPTRLLAHGRVALVNHRTRFLQILRSIIPLGIFFKLSWLDYATRENAPSAIHYAAFELRYGIEYLLFQLLVLASDSLSLKQYKQTIGNPQATRKLLASLPRNYTKLAEFAEIVVSVDRQAPRVQFWNLSDLFRDWGIASEFIRFTRKTGFIVNAFVVLDSFHHSLINRYELGDNQRHRTNAGRYRSYYFNLSIFLEVSHCSLSRSR